MELVKQEYEAQVIELCKRFSDEKEKLKQLLASKGRLVDRLQKSAEYKLLIEFVKRQSYIYCEIILNFHSNPYIKISDAEKSKYKDELDNILAQLEEDIQSVNIVKEDARLKFESICSKINFNAGEKCVNNITSTDKERIKLNIKKMVGIVYDELKDIAAKIISDYLKG